MTRKFAALAPLVLACVSSISAQQAPAPAAPAAPQKLQLASYLVRNFDLSHRNLVDAAEKMPEEHYGFRPVPEMRPFAHTVAHAALSRFGACSAMRGLTSPKAGEKMDAPRTKAEAVALLKEAGAYCTESLKALTDETLTEIVVVGPNKSEVQRGVFAAGELSHGNEVYGTMTVYLRLKGLVPPTTERAQQQRKS